jgi:hypothetical protein
MLACAEKPRADPVLRSVRAIKLAGCGISAGGVGTGAPNTREGRNDERRCSS